MWEKAKPTKLSETIGIQQKKTTKVTKAMTILGSGRGGVNGDNTFFDLLAEKWKLVDTLSLDTLPWPKP